jgi:hypothetical protein
MSILERIFRIFLREMGGVTTVYISNKTSIKIRFKGGFFRVYGNLG